MKKEVGEVIEGDKREILYKRIREGTEEEFRGIKWSIKDDRRKNKMMLDG